MCEASELNVSRRVEAASHTVVCSPSEFHESSSPFSAPCKPSFVPPDELGVVDTAKLTQ